MLILHDRTPFKSHHAGAPSSTNCLQYSFNNRNDQTSYASFLCLLMQSDYSSPRTLYYKEKTFSIVLNLFIVRKFQKNHGNKNFSIFLLCYLLSTVHKNQSGIFQSRENHNLFLGQSLNKLNISIFCWLKF